METFQKVAQTIAQRKGITADQITMDTKFQDLKLDSLDVAELVMDLEDAFSVTIEITGSMTSVNDMVKIIDEARA